MRYYSDYFKYVILKACEELGDDEVFDRVCHVQNILPMKRKSTISRWRSQVSKHSNDLREQFDKFVCGQLNSSSFFYHGHIIEYHLILKDFYRQQRDVNELSNLERSVFRKYLNKERLTKSDVRLLRCGALIDRDLKLTNIGRSFSLSTKSLKSQCDAIDIPIEQVHLPYSERPLESIFCDHMSSFQQWYYVENDIWRVFIRDLERMIFDVMRSFYSGVRVSSILGVKAFGFEEIFLDAFTEKVFSDYLYFIRNENRSLDFCFAKNNSYKIQSNITSDVVVQILEGIGFSRMKKILERYANEPLSCVRGWPDLISVSFGVVSLVEIKGKESLTVGQLENFSFIKNLFDGRLVVNKIILK
ncbi:hypothetical protein [Halopseudomonas yangmingensis]|uniref:Uncharacterized protein n=1 Tax=Halopseudomonas yangmingensis TaxID=1720063 RepID=A0A1I4SYZ4_9GAMM|nr:hypothetical protein [Halopseudomonas yangmingensis]SFM69696.1 hypothetical protein SAMN05216217_11225 [Halopseudomonas yangmingensis]